jgi:hypothetical protein
LLVRGTAAGETVAVHAGPLSAGAAPLLLVPAPLLPFAPLPAPLVLVALDVPLLVPLCPPLLPVATPLPVPLLVPEELPPGPLWFPAPLPDASLS